MLGRKPDSVKKFTTVQKMIPAISSQNPSQKRQACGALLLVLLVLVTPGPVIDAIKNLLALPVMPPNDSGFPMDKVVHCLMFAGCAFLSARAWTPLIYVCFLLLLFAAMTEFLQTLVPGRSGDVADFLADTVGIVMGLWWFHRLKKVQV